MIAGFSILSRGIPASSLMNGVSVGPPGTRMFTVIPVSASSLAQTADMDSSAAFDAP